MDDTANALPAKRKKYKPPYMRTPLEQSIWKFKDSYQLLILFLPCFLYLIFFSYVPIWGISIAFMEYRPFLGFRDSPWVGLEHFRNFFNDPFATRIIVNTFMLSFYDLIIAFPFTIVFALVVNEIKQPRIKKSFQTITYMPNFISTVVIVGMMRNFLSPGGGFLFNILQSLGFPRIDIFSFSGYFRTLYIGSGIWSGTGWGAIIFYAAFAGISPELYESAVIDGANKFKQIIHITIPSILPTIAILFILRTGTILSIGFDKAFLMQSPPNLSTSEVISTYVYKGLVGNQMSFASAVGLFNSVVNLFFILLANYGTKKMTQTSGLF